jgi:proton glutamate symport protein
MSHSNQESASAFSFLLSPLTMLISGVVGIAIGIFQPGWVVFIEPVSTVYASILKMCIAPILLSSIPINLGLLVHSNVSKLYLKKIVITMIFLLFVVSLAGMASGIIFKVGNALDVQVLRELGSIVAQSNYAPDLEMEILKDYSVKEIHLSDVMIFINHLIPNNIFQALSNNENVKVLFFVILFGISIGIVQKEKASDLFALLEILYLVVNKLIEWLVYLLPLALMGSLAAQFASVGIDILFAMTEFALLMIVTYLIVFIISNIIMAYWANKRFGATLTAIGKPSIIALATGSSIDCIPSAISSLIEKFSLNKQMTNLLTPLGFTIFRFGNVLYFAVASIFVIQLYQVDISTGKLLIVLFGSILAGVATAGTSGDLTLGLLVIILQPLGLPLEAVLVLFTVIDPVIDPFRTLCTVHINLVSTVLVVKADAGVVNNAPEI